MDSMREQLREGSFLDNRYEVIAPLNHGSFGMVSLGRDIKENELVAIKCLVKPTTEGSVEYDDDAQELYFHALLGNHPYIVNVRNSFETDSHLFIVLEYCSMGDLYEAIRLDKGPLETQHVRDFMLQLISAVEYMHSRGVYHRDIKPENIFLTQEGDIKLGDFGLATTDKLSDDVCVGSDRYMAPEQYDPSNGPYEPAKADIWAIGICLLNVLFARNPFIVPTHEDPLFADFTFDRETLFDIFPTMTDQTFDVLSHCLQLDPSKRSLEKLRYAITNVTAWSTDDEIYDDYCIEDRDAHVTASTREPLRTPSLTSPQVNLGGGFPWAQALNSDTQQRQLSTIYDDEPYVAVPQSEAAKPTKFPESYDSGLGMSIPSLAKKSSPFKAISYFSNSRIEIIPPKPFKLSDSNTDTKAQTTLSPVTPTFVSNASVPNIPINFSKKPVSYSSKSDSGVSMSWSDIFDEDEEEEQLAMQRLKENNSRTWSADKKPSSAKNTLVKAKFLDEDVFGIEAEPEFDDDSEWVTGGWEDFHI
jgi:serine/threonine protein kinase